MKTLHLFNQFLPLSEAWAYNLLSSLNHTEIAIGAIYFSNNFDFLKFELVNKEDNQLYKKLLIRNKTLDQINIRFIKLKRRLYKKEFLSISKWINENKPQLIHVHFATTAVHFFPLLKKINIPFIVSFYGYDYEKALHDNPDYIKIYQDIFVKSKKILVEGHNGKLLLIKLGCKEEKIFIIKLGVVNHNSAIFSHKKQDPLQLIQIANFLPKKGHFTIIKMIIENRDKWKDKIHITFYGNKSSDYANWLQKKVSSEKVDSFFTFNDNISYENIPSVLKNYDVFIHPSQYGSDLDCEGGAPTILLDAQANGLPVISTLHCDIPSYVKDGVTGLLVPESDTNQLAIALKTFIEMDQTTYQKMAIAAKKHIEDHYDITKNGAVLEYFYKSLLKI